MTGDFGADVAIERYHAATKALREVVLDYPEIFPKSNIGPGFIAEYDAAIYLKKKYVAGNIAFGSGSQRGWDIAVEFGSAAIRFQIKCVDEGSNNRRINFSNKSFDKLIVLSLGDFFVPSQVYLFDDAACLKNVRSLTVPAVRGDRRRGSDLFRTAAQDITCEFLESME